MVNLATIWSLCLLLEPGSRPFTFHLAFPLFCPGPCPSCPEPFCPAALGPWPPSGLRRQRHQHWHCHHQRRRHPLFHRDVFSGSRGVKRLYGMKVFSSFFPTYPWEWCKCPRGSNPQYQLGASISMTGTKFGLKTLMHENGNRNRLTHFTSDKLMKRS